HITNCSTPITTTLSLHDALPIYQDRDDRNDDEKLEQRKSATRVYAEIRNYKVGSRRLRNRRTQTGSRRAEVGQQRKSAKPLTLLDRKSTRLNSSHVAISYAVFCL